MLAILVCPSSCHFFLSFARALFNRNFYLKLADIHRSVHRLRYLHSKDKEKGHERCCSCSFFLLLKNRLISGPWESHVRRFTVLLPRAGLFCTRVFTLWNCPARLESNHWRFFHAVLLIFRIPIKVPIYRLHLLVSVLTIGCWFTNFFPPFILFAGWWSVTLNLRWRVRFSESGDALRIVSDRKSVV